MGGGMSFGCDSNVISKIVKVNSQSICHQRRSSCHHGVDMISPLPEDVIVNILSFLPLNEAARTSVLSSQWPELWKHASNHVFVRKCYADKMAERYGLGHEYHEWVDSVLKSHKAFTLKEFTISIVVKESIQCAITKWYEPVNSRRVVRLELNFRSLGGKDGGVLEEILEEINCDVLKPVKEVHVKNIHELSEEDVMMFLRKCPYLFGIGC